MSGEPRWISWKVDQPNHPGRLSLVVKLAVGCLVTVAVAVWAGIAMHAAWQKGQSVLLPALALFVAAAGSVVSVFLTLSPLLRQVADTAKTPLDGVVADRERMRQLAAQVIEAADRERASLARELHDSTAQSMAAIVMQLSALQRDAGDGPFYDRIEAVRGIAEQATEEVRTLAHTMHPRVLDDLGLAAALQALVRRVQDTSQMRMSTDIMTDNGLAPHLSSVLYRVAQEAVHNAQRHSAANSVRLELTRGEQAARLEVIDDGRGFDVEEAALRRPGMGLFTMRERLMLVGGALQIISAPSAGTRVVATVPLDPTETWNAR